MPIPFAHAVRARLTTLVPPGHPGPWLLLAAGAVFASRVSFLPSTLGDIDSVNFALALDRFDPALHQPHPPGYPVYIALARLVYALVPDAPKALALLSALAQAALVLPLFALFQRLSSTPNRAVLSTALTLACPILWFNGARPMSDSVGLLFVVSTQALLLRSLDTGRMLPAASLLAGLSLGVRLQAGLLTIPLWLWTLRRHRSWRRPLAAIAAGIGIWAIPLVIASGGPLEYARVFAETMGQAAESEPLIVKFTLNRASRALLNVSLGPWISSALGLWVMALGTIGLLATAVRRRPTLLLAGIAFLPYFLFHALIQQAETVRYSLPYIPGIAWLAIEGLGALKERFRSFRFVEVAACGALVTVAAALTVPALALYRVTPSPPYAALRAIEARASPRRDFVLAGHYRFWRYFPLRPAGLSFVSAAPGEAIPRLVQHFLTGDQREVLFLASPRRTDLVSFSRISRRLLGRWEWPASVRPFLSGERPNRAELYAIKSPLFFSSEGWLLSLESGRLDEIPSNPSRFAYLKEMPVPGFLLVAGVPRGRAMDCHLDIVLPGVLAEREPCGQPLLRGYVVPARSAAGEYRRLSVTTTDGDGPLRAPFVLDGLDYGPADQPGFVQGEGWFHPEKDEERRRFRWVSPRARTLLHVPAGGARLVIEGTAPLNYLGPDPGIELTQDGRSLASARLTDGRFRLEAEISEDGRPFHEVILSTRRSFVPDEVQRNGDRRRLAVRVYAFSLEAPNPTP